jgi:hypothetical protein
MILIIGFNNAKNAKGVQTKLKFRIENLEEMEGLDHQ